VPTGPWSRAAWSGDLSYTAAMEFSSETFRLVMGHFATGVTIVTVFDGDEPDGITVNALSSVSLDPPLVMVALDRRRHIVPAVRAAGRYAVNVLGEDQQHLSDCFAGAELPPGRDLFCGATWRPGETGLPLIDGSIATLECTIVQTVSVGDHDLFIGRVDALASAGDHPLLYFRRRYLRVEKARAVAPQGRP
jgi:3-hydroxy-9,10-secoandrosta-1,3,5(10)-triene-9,17-dione monooxygenase reductase component